MDELAAAAAVVTMSIDDKAEEELGQRGSCVTVGACDATMADVDTSAEDKENNDGHAAVATPEDAPSKVPNASPILLRILLGPPLTRSDSHALTARKCLCAGASGCAAAEGRPHVP